MGVRDPYYSDLGIPIGATDGEPKVTDYGQADLRPFAMGALAQQHDYQPTDARGTDLWGYQMGGTVVPPQEIDKAINMVMATSGGGLATKGIKAYHSSPHDFDRFDVKKIGTGEGAQVYGHGLYFAENPAVSGQGGQYWSQFLRRFEGPEAQAAELLKKGGFNRAQTADELQAAIDGLVKAHPDNAAMYAPMLDKWQKQLEVLRSDNPVGPRTYEVNIKADPAQMLDWDKPLGQQAVGDTVARMLEKRMIVPDENMRGVNAYGELGTHYDQLFKRPQNLNADQAASVALQRAGIPGIKYLDEGSRANAASRRVIEEAAQLLPNDAAVAKRLQELNALPAPTSNYVVFDPDQTKIEIMKKYGVMGAPAGALGSTYDQSQYELKKGKH